MLLLWTSRQAD